MKKLKALVLCLTLAISILLASCTKTEKALKEVRVAYFPNITHAQALVMKSEGMLEEKLDDGLNVKWISFNAGPAEIEALFASEVDIGYIGPVPAINGYVQSKGDLRIIAGASNGGSVLISRSDLGKLTAADLDGKKVAVPQLGNTQHLSLLSLLKQNNLAPTTAGGTVEVVPSSNADIVNLLDQKRVDAALVPEPWGSIMEMDKNGIVSIDYDKIDASGIPSTAVVIVSKDFLTNHRDVVEKFMAAHKEATMFINDKSTSAKAKDIVNTQIFEVTQNKIDTKVLDSAFKRLNLTEQIPTDSIKSFADISVAEKFIEAAPDDNIIDSSFIK